MPNGGAAAICRMASGESRDISMHACDIHACKCFIRFVLSPVLSPGTTTVAADVSTVCSAPLQVMLAGSSIHSAPHVRPAAPKSSRPGAARQPECSLMASLGGSRPVLRAGAKPHHGPRGWA